MAQTWLDELNPRQRQAATHGDGPLLIVAGAGTGKTKTLACRVAHLIERGVDPARILLLTFTRRAAGEMINRARHITEHAAVGRVWSGTFHAVANRLLRLHGSALDLPGDFTVMDEGDAADLMNLIRNELGLTSSDRRFPKKATLVKVYSHTVNAQRPLSEVLERHFPWCKEDREGIARIFAEYTRRKTEQHLLDYDDLLLYWHALTAVPHVGEKVAGRFDHILVDEYQDTNTIQARILRGMCRKHSNIVVVGDDAQSIYAFRAATIRNILDFPDHFPGTTVVTLEQNYRSTQPILDASNAVMEAAKERYTKDLWSERCSEQRPILMYCEDETDQTEAVCRRILDHLEEGIALMQQAVLFRASHHSAELEIELTRRNIPFHKFGGLRFVETAHIKDMLACLRILENPHDRISWFRVLQLMDGIGPRTAGRIMDDLENAPRRPEPRASARTNARPPIGGASRPITHEGARIEPRAGSDATSSSDSRRGGRDRPSTPLLGLLRHPPPVPAAAREQFAAMRKALADCAGVSLNGRDGNAGEVAPETARKPTVASQIEIITRFYKPIFKRIYENAAVRLRDLEQLEQIAAKYRSRGRFITDLTLDPPRSTSDLAGKPSLDDDYLTLSTIHSAKGCEWTAVHIIHAADGMIPSDLATGDESGVDEERRLFYVAMTRARDFLYVYFPLRYYHRRYALGDGHGYAQLTRFLPDANRALFEQRTAGEGAENDDSPSEPEFKVNLDRLWRS